MELYSYDYALKALWLYTSEPEWASNWSSFERRRASTPIMTGTHGVWAKLVWERKSGPWAITSASIALLFAGFPHLVD